MKFMPDDRAVPFTELALQMPEGSLRPARGGFVVSSSGDVAAGVVFHCWRPKARSVELSAAAVRRSWLSRGVLRDLADYAYRQLKCVRLEVHRKGDGGCGPLGELLEKAGFTHEGTLRRAWDGRADAEVWGMLKGECPWYRC